MSAIRDRLELALNGELARRLLIKYFAERGFKENFDRAVYPPILQDLVEAIPQLEGKVEVEPHAVEVDPKGGHARLGWNLFVLGNQRMFLGETDHTDLSELARAIDSGQPIVEQTEAARQTRSAREIITWVTRTLARSMAGIIRDVGTEMPIARPPMAGSNSQSMFERPKTIRPEGTSQF
jgi:hypothetical protein